MENEKKRRIQSDNIKRTMYPLGAVSSDKIKGMNVSYGAVSSEEDSDEHGHV